MKKGTKHSDESKARMTASKVGVAKSQEHRAKISAGALARFAKIRDMEQKLAAAGLL